MVEPDNMVVAAIEITTIEEIKLTDPQTEVIDPTEQVMIGLE